MIWIRQSLGNPNQQFLGLFQSLLIGTKLRLAHRNLMNLFLVPFSSLHIGREHPLAKAFGLKEHKVAKEKLQFSQAWVWVLGHLVSEQALHLYPDRLHGVLSFSEPKLSTNSEAILG